MKEFLSPFAVENAVKQNIENLSGYNIETTYISDILIAEPFGMKAVAETIDNAWKEHEDDYRILTEIVIIVNHLSWVHHATTKDTERIEYYSEKYYELRDKFYDKFEGNGEACSYYFQMTD